MHSPDLFRVMIDERERQIQAHLRVRRLLGSRRPAIRWHRSLQPPRHPAADGRVR